MLYNISIHLSRLHKVLLHRKQICDQVMESVRQAHFYAVGCLRQH